MREKREEITKRKVSLKDSKSFLGTFLVFIVVLFMMSCSRKTMQVALPVSTPDSFSISGDTLVPDKWWLVFNDETLNDIVDSALVSNFTLKTAWQRLIASRAVTERASSGLYPDLGTSLQGGADYPTPDYVGGESFRFELNSEYEVDLWGRIRSAVQAERYRTEATLADYQTAAISLSAEIVRTWFRLAEARNQLKLVNKQIDTNTKMLTLIKARFSSGQIRSADILRQQQLLEATRGQKIVVEADVNILVHQLNVLLGQTPWADLPSDAQLPELPPVPETGVPADLIKRRTDVQSAYNHLLAADRDLASAISNKYPRFSIRASASVRANNLDDLFQDWAYSLAGNLFSPIFEGKALRAEEDRAEALKKQRAYEFGETMLTAFREVEDALVREESQTRSIENIEKQIELITKTNGQLRIEYLNGMSNYLDVLTSMDQEQQLRRNLLSARLELLEYRIALYRAIAGGFETERESEDLADI